MNRMNFVVSAALVLSAVPAVAADAGNAAQNAADMLVGRFMEAWNTSDARALSSLFAPDADFISPYGDEAKGRDEIRAFYAGAFLRGYAGSKGQGDIVAARALSADMTLIDAHWRIDGAKNPDGSLRAGEKGILVAVIGKRDGAWHILALRENVGTAEIRPISRTPQ